MPTTDDPRDIGLGWVEAINAHDMDAVSALLAPDAVFWTNTGVDDMSREQRLAILATEFEVLDDFGWYDVQARPFAGGCLLQMRVRGSTVAGDFDAPMCSVLFVNDGKVTRIESYVNPVPLEPLARALLATIEES